VTIDFDPFAPDTDQYSPEKFYTKAYNKHDHTSVFRWGQGKDEYVNVPHHLIACSQHLKEVAPMLKTNHDIMRDALVHYFRMRQEQYNAGLPTSWHNKVDRILAIAAIEEAEDNRRTHEDMLTRMESHLRDAGTDEELAEAIERCERAALTMDIGSVIRRAAVLIDRYRR
jgi:hypothetical protein